MLKTRAEFEPFVDRDGVKWRVYQFNKRQNFHSTPTQHYVILGGKMGGEFRGFVPDLPPRRPRRVYTMRHNERAIDNRTDNATLQRQLDESEIDPRDV